jgi:hypothetical protein
MENKLFLRRLNIFLQNYDLQEESDLATLDDAIRIYSLQISKSLRLANILDKILIILNEMDIFLERFAFDASSECYANLYKSLRETANKYQDDVDYLSDQCFKFLSLYLKEAPAAVKTGCHLPLEFNQDIEQLYKKINIIEISRKINDSAASLSSCVEEDTLLFGEYIMSILN